MEKNDAQIRFCSREKSSKSLKKNFFEKKKKKFFQLICTDKTYKTVCGRFFKINESRDINLSAIFRFQKIVLHHNIINKTRSTKIQENSAHHFGDNYLTNHFITFLQDKD